MKQMDMSSLTKRRYFVRGMTLIELMIAIALGLIVVLALLFIFENVVRSNREMAKSSEQIENGRFAIQILGDDLKHAGFWGDYVPVYDDLTTSDVPADVPAAIPDPCLPYPVGTGWNVAYINGLVGIPVQIYRTPPANCSFISNQKANTDIFVVRHLETCAVGETGCDALDNNKVYFQSSLCVGTAQAGTNNTITLAAITPAVTGTPAVGVTPAVAATYDSSDVVRIVGGTGVGQTRTVSSYDQNTKVLTVTSDWATVPDATSSYSFGATDFLLGRGADTFRLRAKNCVAFADRRKLISNIYYVRDDGNNASTLMRARFDSTASSPNYVVEPIVEGIEGFRAEIGVDNVGEAGAVPNYAQAVTWVNASRTQASNRGDGAPDKYCNSTTTGSAACLLDDLVNAVRVNLFVLSKTNDKTVGYVDNKTYCLGSVDASGVCPSGYSVTPSGAEQGFRRHVFSSAVRINNISGRRETP
jgi:type IV pilus assembly protein PilW